MLEAFKSLPEDPDELRAISVQMAQHIQSQAYQIEKLKAELHGHRKARFGAKSESIDQLALDRMRPVKARFQAFTGCQFHGMSSSMRLIL